MLIPASPFFDAGMSLHDHVAFLAAVADKQVAMVQFLP
jgi:hypothetical protein